MSQRPTASRPASRSPPDGQSTALPSVQLRDDLQQGGRPAESQQQTESQGFPPQHARTSQGQLSGEDWRSSAPSRDLGVRSILNPSEPEGGGLSRRRPSGTTTESPQSTNAGPAQQYRTSPSGASTHSYPGLEPHPGTPPMAEGYGSTFPKNRRILTPRSPSRAFSSGRSGGQGTPRSPFLPSRGRPYTAEPGPSSDIPPIPTSLGQYGAASTPSIAPRRASGGTMQAPGRTPLSQSASPSISASSQNPSSSQTSPASFLFQKGGQAYFPGSSFGTSTQQGGGMQFQGHTGAPEGPYSAPAPQTQGPSLHSSSAGSAGSSRQTSASDPIQVLTITTAQGSYHVPVDVHQASRVADEKRARNAGASARFRQRRKEKEKEANINIEKLQQQTRELERKIREVEQERDFYRAERDRFRDVVFRTPEMRHLVMQAPPSPQSIRAGTFPGSMPQMGGPPPPPPAPMSFQPVDSSSERAPRRRRTDAQGDFTSLPYTLPPASTLPPVQAPGYHPGPTAPNLPPLRIENTAVPKPQPSGMVPATTAGPPSYDPYARGPYERGWPGEGGRR